MVLNLFLKRLKKEQKYIITSKNTKRHKSKTIKVGNEIKFLNEFASKKDKIRKLKFSQLLAALARHRLKIGERIITKLRRNIKFTEIL